jgi:hypothetical protein
MTGCTNPNAINYYPAADEDDGSCIFLNKVGGISYAFKQTEPSRLTNKSFTLSYSVEGNCLVFFHDYIPDFYFSTRQQLYTLKNNAIWKHNQGAAGKFYNDSKNSFFVDIVFAFEREVFLSSLQWITQVLDMAGKLKPFETLTNVTIWNDSQCTGRLDVQQFVTQNSGGVAKSMSEFSFNDFSDIVKTDAEFFMMSVFDNLRPAETILDPSMPWYEKGNLQNNHFIVRLEYDNVNNRQIAIHSADTTVQETYK